MVAGAGSGKTTSLVKALAHLSSTRGEDIRRRGQQIACITYTEVAVGEIWGDVGNAPLFHVSTIHNFLWTIIRPFQNDIRRWVDRRLEERIEEANERIAKPGTQANTRARLQGDVLRYTEQRVAIAVVAKFVYGTGADYVNGILGHDDILKIGATLIGERELMRKIVANRFPFIFVDESQDTTTETVEALRAVAREHAGQFCLGFFGDPMQKIYTTGVGAIAKEDGWAEITKPENFRCPRKVLGVVNRIRVEDDGLEQVRGRTAREGNVDVSVEGSARIFVLPADGQRTQRLAQVRQWLADHNQDPLWLDNSSDGDVRLVVLVHRMAADRLGFPNLYAALNDNGSNSLKDGLLDGTAWVLRPFKNFLMPVVQAINSGRDFDVIGLARKHCPLMLPEYLNPHNTRQVLDKLKINLDDLAELMADGVATTRQILDLARERQLCTIDDRFLAYIQNANGEAGGGQHQPEPGEAAAVGAFLNCISSELWSYEAYVENQSPFDTHQGVKGAEFFRVLVVLDDEEANYNLFSFGKYFRYVPLSGTDQENIAAGKDSVIGRTRRLFYVCCSRAIQDLAVVLFVPTGSVESAAANVERYFLPEDVHLLADMEAVPA